MIRARRSGQGAYVKEWRLSGAEFGDGAAAEAILAWCREVAGQCRRPFGIASFDLAVAVGCGEGRPRSVSFKHLLAADLYGEQLASKLNAALGAPAGVVHVAAALFSWGDAAHDALPAS